MGVKPMRILPASLATGLFRTDHDEANGWHLHVDRRCVVVWGQAYVKDDGGAVVSGWTIDGRLVEGVR